MKAKSMCRVACVFLAALALVCVHYYPASGNAMLAGPSKAAIVGKMAIPSASSYASLTTLCGETSNFQFRGYVAFDPGNAGAANVMKATIAGAADVTCAAGAVATFQAVDSDSIQIQGAVTDYVNIVGEKVIVVQDTFGPNYR